MYSPCKGGHEGTGTRHAVQARTQGIGTRYRHGHRHKAHMHRYSSTHTHTHTHTHNRPSTRTWHWDREQVGPLEPIGEGGVLKIFAVKQVVVRAVLAVAVIVFAVTVITTPTPSKLRKLVSHGT